MIEVRTWKKAWDLLDTEERREALMVSGVIVMSALASALMVGSIMPFLTVLSNPSSVAEIPALLWVHKTLGITSTYSLLITLGVLSFSAVVFSSVVQVARVWATARFSTMRTHSISHRLLSLYLSQPYEFFLNRHSGEMGPRVLAESGQVVSQFFTPAAELISASLVTIAIVGLLVWVEPVIAATAFAVIGCAYLAVFIAARHVIKSLGKTQLMANRERFRFANESLTGIKDIKLLGREVSYLDQFAEPSVLMARTLIKSSVISSVPQFAVQAIALGGVILLCLALVDPSIDGSEVELGEFLPTLGIFAFAGQRLLPEFSKLYRSLTMVQSASAAVDAIHDDLKAERNVGLLNRTQVVPCGLKQFLRLESVFYRYPKSDQVGLNNISLMIEAGEKIGIVGSTGAGKTTLADVLLGLLTPSDGRLVVDGQEINSENVRAWMLSVGYVPQDIFLTDASVEENIALGTPQDEIDNLRICRAARIARIDQFIENELPDGYKTYVGERGVRLSGGQRQRIGIARALYHDADLIIFDEATSALDNLTESEVISAIDALPGDKTVFMIAHRLSTVKLCDRIIVLEHGKIVGCGSWDELMNSNKAFQRIAKLGGAASTYF